MQVDWLILADSAQVVQAGQRSAKGEPPGNPDKMTKVTVH